MARRSRSTLPVFAVLGLGAAALVALVVMLGGDPSSDEASGAPLVLDDRAGAGDDPSDLSPFGRGGSDGGSGGRSSIERKPPPRTGPQRIAGRVFDLDTGKPIPTWQVTVLPDGPGDPIERLEEADPVPFHQRHGVFSLAQEPGRYDVVVQAPGYLPGVLADVIVPALSGEPDPVGLSRGPAIAGQVIGHDGYPRPNVTVFLDVLALSDPSKPPRIAITKTGFDGAFSFSPLPDGEYAVSPISRDNTEDRVAGIRVYGRPTTVTLHLSPRHQVSFRVQSLQGKAIDGARLELTGGGRFESGQSGTSGLIVVDHLPDGSYSLTVNADGYTPLTEELVLDGGMGDHARWLTLDPLPPDGG